MRYRDLGYEKNLLKSCRWNPNVIVRQRYKQFQFLDIVLLFKMKYLYIFNLLNVIREGKHDFVFFLPPQEWSYPQEGDTFFMLDDCRLFTKIHQNTQSLSHQFINCRLCSCWAILCTNVRQQLASSKDTRRSSLKKKVSITNKSTDRASYKFAILSSFQPRTAISVWCLFCSFWTIKLFAFFCFIH